MTEQIDESWDSVVVFEKLSAIRDSYTREYMSWHATLQEKFGLHPVVKSMLAHKPDDWGKLAMEFPYISETDPTRIAYTRSIADGANNRQLVTSVGKYLARHWPRVPDHTRRDAQALFTPDTMTFVRTIPEMVRGVEMGPRSCMASIHGSIPFKDQHHSQMKAWFADPTLCPPNWSDHPYSAYRPDLGWSMALRTTGAGSIDGRALVYEKGTNKCFVRTYRRHPTDPSGWSQTDFALQGWLIGQGFEFVSSWPANVQLHTPSEAGRVKAPYIDGNERSITGGHEGNGFLSRLIHDTGDYVCNSTTGYAESADQDEDDEDDDGVYCDSCDTHRSQDDMCYAGRDDDIYLCSYCRDDNYAYVSAQRTRGTGPNFRSYVDEYYIPNSEVGETTSHCKYDAIDPDYPPDDVVQLTCGNWAEVDDSICINGDWYLDDDSDVCEFAEPLNDDVSHGLKADSFQDPDGDYWFNEAHYRQYNPVTETEETEVTEVTT